ncbi:unnamed protein product [Ixodes persulcatus]
MYVEEGQRGDRLMPISSRGQACIFDITMCARRKERSNGNHLGEFSETDVPVDDCTHRCEVIQHLICCKLKSISFSLLRNSSHSSLSLEKKKKKKKRNKEKKAFFFLFLLGVMCRVSNLQKFPPSLAYWNTTRVRYTSMEIPRPSDILQHVGKRQECTT